MSLLTVTPSGVRVLAPAKVNLYLRVIRRRPDGYHELDTLFERVGLYDKLTFRHAPALTLRCSDPSLPTDERNLALKAALALKRHSGYGAGASIRLVKRIPHAAGLGGGSSDAAAVLLGLDRLWRLGYGVRKLSRIGLEVGSDVPFFVAGVPFAVGRGRGERLRPVPAGGVRLWHVLVKPPFGISTREAYQGLDPVSLTPYRADAKMLLRSAKLGEWERLAGFLRNDLEVSLNKRVTEIAKIKAALVEQGAHASLLSGSGSTVFGVYASARLAARAARRLRRLDRRWKVFVAPTV
ncbi:MAG: 4-diphosphocytidyl-2-C-methyl-D-erythritol kinase [Candidatus Omnitrophica bacterium]|nr:4-diphosphocytidyl-2-C-methyl-D-erythritol kinase [Candidatus Omnitrophota bacterium]